MGKNKFPPNKKNATQPPHILQIVFINDPCKEGKEEERTLLFPRKEVGEDSTF